MYADELFTVDATLATTVVFPVGRLVVDPERFLDDVATHAEYAQQEARDLTGRQRSLHEQDRAPAEEAHFVARGSPPVARSARVDRMRVQDDQVDAVGRRPADDLP